MRSLGHTVEVFPSATAFLASPDMDKTACLIADVNMPAMSGPELFRHLIQENHAMPTILVTAYPNSADRDRAMSDGVVCYLRKPVDESNLSKCIGRALAAAK